MECKEFFNPLKTRIKLINSLWISIRFLIILVSLEAVRPGVRPTRKLTVELLNKDYTDSAFVCEKLKALNLM